MLTNSKRSINILLVSIAQLEDGKVMGALLMGSPGPSPNNKDTNTNHDNNMNNDNK